MQKAGWAVDTRAPQVLVMVPAHNEADQIAATISSLLTQSRSPNRIVVVADNCTDATVNLAASMGVEVFTTVGNTHKKAGALNQALAKFLPAMADEDAVLVMDADSTLCPEFLEHALARIAPLQTRQDWQTDYDACGGVFTGKAGGGMVGMFQRNEFARYARDVRRLRGKALVLTGTATVFRVSVLNEVIAARAAGELPGAAEVYDVKVLTEDNELTFALLHLGKKIIAPAECALSTDVMRTWGDLYRQRRRWKRGALENLFEYGWTPVTRKYWGRQALSLAGLLVTMIYLTTLVLTLAFVGDLVIHPLWMALTLLFVAEQVITVRARGKLMMLLAALLIVEMVYDIFLQATQIKAFWDTAFKAERSW